MFAFSGYMIWLAADPFAEGLKLVGENLGVSPFLIVQWIAPLASESPEVVIALLFALKGKGSTGIGALISSKVNQWTLLVGAIPLVYAISAGAWIPLDLDSRQREELLLTSAQSIFAAIVISDFRFSVKEAMLLFCFFMGQFIFPTENERYIFSGIYIIAAIVMIATSKTRRLMLLRALRLKTGTD
jgi:cation:H+ antiporter